MLKHLTGLTYIVQGCQKQELKRMSTKIMQTLRNAGESSLYSLLLSSNILNIVFFIWQMAPLWDI